MGLAAVASDGITGLQKPPRLPGLCDGSCSQARSIEPALVRGAGTPSAMLWAQQVPWTPSRGRRHSFSSYGGDGEAGLRSERASRDRQNSRGRSEFHQCEASSLASSRASEQAAGASSRRAASQGRRHFSSVSSSSNASKKPSHWAAQMSNRSMLPSGEDHSRHLRRSQSRSRSPMLAEDHRASEGSLRTNALPNHAGYQNSGQCADAAVVTPQMLSALQAGSQAGVHASALLAHESSATDASGAAGVDGEEQSPAQVVKWLESSASGIPHHVLKNLKEYILKRNIDGVKFASLVTRCDVGAFTTDVDNISVLHLARLRKIWTMRSAPLETDCLRGMEDAVDCQPVAQISIDPEEHCFRAQSRHTQVSPAGLKKPEIVNDNSENYLPLAIMHLARWAGFEPSDAIIELWDKLPQTVVDELSAFFKESDASEQSGEDSSIAAVDTGHDECEHVILAPRRPEQSDRRMERDGPWQFETAACSSDTFGPPTRSVQRLLHHMDAAKLGHHEEARKVAAPGDIHAEPNKLRAPAYVAAWVLELPDSIIKEHDRQNIAANLEAHQLDGDRFTDLIAGRSSLGSVVGISSLAPARILKIRRAWDQVLREDACRRATADTFRCKAGPKPVKLLV